MTKDEKFLKEARTRWKLADEADNKQRKRELEDIQFYNGQQWDADLLASRQGQVLGSGATQQTVPARPCLVINKTKEPVRQVLNQERQSDLGIELIPADDWGEVTGPIDHTEIELREGLVRRIQRDSEAADARTWAFARAAIAGRGYWLVMTRYVPGKSQDQEVYIERIYNQNTVLLDPSHEQPDGSDSEWGFFGRDMLFAEFKAEYTKAKLTKDSGLADNDSMWRSLGDQAPGWFTGEGEKRAVRVMNYYYAERKPKEVYHLTNGGAAYADELANTDTGPRVLLDDPNVSVMVDDDGNELSHTEVVKSIQWCKITGNEILEQTEWPGHWLPIIKTIGEELQPADQERRCEGLVRPMRDACKGNNYIISKFVERVGLTPIPPVIMAGGQDEGFEDEWDAANTRTLSRLHYNLKDSFGQLVNSPPFRADARAEIADIGAGVQIFGEAIQSTSVMPETALGHTDPTVKSGKLAQALIEQGNQGTSNFMDNLVRSMRHEARIVNDLLYPIYGREGRLARLMNGQGEKSAVIIGKPFTVEGKGPNAKPMPVDIPGWQPGMPLPQGVKYFGLTPDANFNVVGKVSKKAETRRAQIFQSLVELVGADPSQMLIVGDLIWKYSDLPEHEEMEKRQKVMLAPPIQQLISGETPLPPEAQAQIAALQQQLAEVMPLADKNKSDLMKVQAQQQGENERAAVDAQTREKIERWKIEAQLEIEMAKLGNASMMKRAEIDADLLHQHNEQQRAEQEQAEQVAADAALADQANQHAQEQAEQGQQHAIEQGMQGQMNALEQGEQSHAQALEQQANAPEPSI